MELPGTEGMRVPESLTYACDIGVGDARAPYGPGDSDVKSVVHV